MNEEQRILITDWWEKLQPLVRKFTWETSLAGFEDDDIRQECFLLLQKALNCYKKETGISFAYYYKVMLRGWRANANRKTRCRDIAWDEEKFGLLKDERIDIENDIERKMLIEKIDNVVKSLEEEERQIIVAYYFEHKKLGEIALRLGLSYKAAEYRKKGALTRLKGLLEGVS